MITTPGEKIEGKDNLLTSAVIQYTVLPTTTTIIYYCSTVKVCLIQYFAVFSY